MTTQNINNNTLNIYPVEQPFKSPLIITAVFVFIPALALYWFFGDSSSFPRSLKLFFGNWISPIILWFFAASFFHLMLKRNKLRKEQNQTQLLYEKVFPSVVNDTTIEYTENELINTLQSTSKQSGVASNNLLNSRLSLFLNHHENDIDETFGIKEREQLKGSFSLSRFMVWAIPILGFIGTVWGISNGIAHFSDAMTNTGSVTDVSAMLKENLPLVTNSLATAFDTTLLALLLSIPLMMLMLSLEKEEEAYLINLDERWFHDIKPALEELNPTPSHYISNPNNVTNTSNTESAKVAGEIKLLSTQIKALQETMEDLYESVFTSKLTERESKDSTSRKD